MAVTRTQTGSLPAKSYKSILVKLIGKDTTKANIGRRKKTALSKSESKPKFAIKGTQTSSVDPNPIVERTATPLPQVPLEELKQLTETSTVDLSKAYPDFCEGDYKWPSVVCGEKETRGLNKIERAEKDVKLWESVWDCHFGEGREGETSGSGENLRGFVNAKLKHAKKVRDEMQMTEENLKVGDGNPGKEAIRQRLEALSWALGTSKFEPERENIRAAIGGYENGAIGYNKHITVFYAGKIVDTAPDYPTFVRTRQEKLDSYEKAHGPHWIFYESPLDVHPEEKPQMMKSLVLYLNNPLSGIGTYYINMGFWKRSGWVARLPGSKNTTLPLLEERYWPRQDGRVWCQEEGPKMIYRMLLDSGATCASLYQTDLQNMGIDGFRYSCQSVEQVATANGVKTARIFEIFICVLNEKNEQLVDIANAAYPHFPPYIGSLFPCVEMPGGPEIDANGMEKNQRLSGMVPFLGCYISSTPGKNMMFLGEDRKDVLGMQRVPGQMRWNFEIPALTPPDRDNLKSYGDPKTIFSHHRGDVVDRDDPLLDHASTTTYHGGTPQEYSIRNCPKEEIDRFKADAAQAAQGNGGQPQG